MYFYSLYIGLCHVVLPSTPNRHSSSAQTASPHIHSRQVDIFASTAANLPSSSLQQKGSRSHAKRRQHDRHQLAAEKEQQLGAWLRTTDYRVGRIQIEWHDDAAAAIEQGASMQHKQQGPMGVFEAQPTLSAECEIGILRLYRGRQQHLEPPQLLPRHMQKEDKSKDCERPRVLAVLAVPGYMTPTDFLSFASGFAESIEHVRVVRDSSQNHYMILLRFRAMADADAFYAYYNGKTFSPLEPETCHVVYVSAVECESKEIPAGSDEAPVDGRVSAPAAALFLRPAWADSGDADELPTCPVCLERLDSSTSGLLTILCQHTFHCGCLARWGDGSCPVCRHSQTSPFVDQERFRSAVGGFPQIHLAPKPRKAAGPDASSDALSQQQASGSGTPDAGPSASPGSSSSVQQGEAGNCCSVCREANDLWICLICGTIGCGRYVNGHAKDHFNQTQHPYSMELESQCVWDYVGDGYVHRLIQNKADGKVIEFAAPERSRNPGAAGGSSGTMWAANHSARAAAGGGGGYVEDGHMGSFVDAREKLDAVTEEYEILLTSQLESQREHYEMQIARMQHQQSQWPKQYAELERKYDALSGRCRELEQKCQAQESRHQTETQGLSSKMEEERKEWAAERRRLEASATKWLKKSTEDARLLLDEKALSKQLLDNQDALKKQVADLKESMADLQEQVRDLTFFISTQKVIEKEQQQEGGGGELEGASVVGVAEAPQPKGKGKGKGKRRILPRK